MCEVREIFYFGDRIVTDIERGELCLANTIALLSLPSEQKSIDITNGMLKILQLFDTIVAEI